jgi:cytoskeletal protein RodZ
MNTTVKYLLMLCIGAAAASAFMHFKSNNHNFFNKHHSHHGNQASQKEARSSQHQHDEINMPGLQGEDITEQEIDDLKKIFRSHEGIVRSVEKLPNGIITITEAQDVELRDAIVSHVSMMVTRLQEGKNPAVIIQSPTLDALFGVYEEIDTEIEKTGTGVKVTQTSSNAAVVNLLQKHAVEVTDMTERGMTAVHERMKGGRH